MRGLRKFLVTVALAGGLAFAGAVGAGSAVAAPAQPPGALAYNCGEWVHVPPLPQAVWGRACRGPVPAQGAAAEVYNGRAYSVRVKVTVISKLPWADAVIGLCDSWIDPSKYYFCGPFYVSEATSQYPIVATFQQMQP
jgi:hypothetical protein